MNLTPRLPKMNSAVELFPLKMPLSSIVIVKKNKKDLLQK
jgi:hypothetical protein